MSSFKMVYVVEVHHKDDNPYEIEGDSLQVFTKIGKDMARFIANYANDEEDFEEAKREGKRKETTYAEYMKSERAEALRLLKSETSFVFRDHLMVNIVPKSINNRSL
jgi:hypothetical protein